jgi:hypothetical protein
VWFPLTIKEKIFSRAAHDLVAVGVRNKIQTILYKCNTIGVGMAFAELV